MCSVRVGLVGCYRATVRAEQKIIADWLERTRERLGMTWGQWAEKAGLGAATTVTRAISDDYKSVTSVPTLHALARAADEPSILDFLSGAAIIKQAEYTPPNEENLASLLDALLPLVPTGRQTGQSLRVVAAALARGLELLGDQPASPASSGELRVAARGAISRFHELTER